MLTTGAVEMLGNDVGFIQLAFNAKGGVVGIRAASEQAKGRYRLRSQKSGSSRLVTGKRFFKHHGLTIEKAPAAVSRESALQALKAGFAVIGWATWSDTGVDVRAGPGIRRRVCGRRDPSVPEELLKATTSSPATSPRSRMDGPSLAVDESDEPILPRG